MKLNTKKLAGTFLAAAMLTSAYAANSTASTNTSTSSIGKSWYQKLKDSPLSASYIHEVSMVRDQTDRARFSGYNQMYYASVSYKFNPKNSLNFFSRWDRESMEHTTSHNSWTYTGLNYYRSGILTQDKNGVNMTFQLRQRFYPNNMKAANRIDAQGASKRYFGYTRPGVIFSRSFTDKLSGSWATHMAFYNRYSGVDGQSSNYFYTYPSINYAITDKFSVGYTLEYFKLHKKGGALGASAQTQTSEDLTGTLEFGYAFHPQLSMGVSSGMTMMRSHDGRTWVKNLDGDFSLAASLVVGLF